ncbi:toxin-antitoxin system YwqK family antitoxin [Aliidiomarina soli]|uniref:Toxin-antitoxin system YwqK family antitoxin n=1 Tax=Aliidiomarina soli TaxID=1928574 RepID=A0A432WFF1_9GAMM|nr:toxin-antitoxin system YwqK family antitoxin [Aliidiomarina soli]RUO32485.1 hypothetical protein CWE14_10080 [Aliidiomarina soli]
MTKLIYVTLFAMACLLGSLSPALAEPEQEQTRWLDRSMQTVEKDDAEYYLAEYEAVEGGYAISVNYAETDSLRLQAQARTLELSETSFFGPYQSFYRSGAVLEEGEYDEQGQRQGTVTVYHESGEVLRSIPYRDNLVHGEYTTYYENGKPRRVQMVENNERHGDNRSYFDNGQLRIESTYHRGDQVGAERSYDRDGNLTREATYEDGKLQGELVEYFPSGEVRAIGNYVDSSPRGEQIEYRSPGDVRRYRMIDENGTTIAEREFRTDGTIQREREPIETDHGPGYQRTNYHTDGSVSEIVQVADNGLWQLDQRFNKDGEEIERRELLNREQVGRFVRTPWGGGTEHGSYEDGELHGRYYETRDGEVVNEGEYQHGKKVGRWDSHDGHGYVVEYFDDEGNLHGERTERNSEGDVILRQTYQHGTLHGPYQQIRDGQVVAEGKFVDGQRQGEWRISTQWSGGDVEHGRYQDDTPVGRWTIYDRYGHRVAIRHYNDQGLRQGRQFEFERDGALSSVIEYQDDVQHGVAIFYRNGVEDSRAVYEDGEYLRNKDDDQP